MEETKIQLSEDELLLMHNSDWILTKNRIMEKINLGFGDLVIKMQQHITTNLPEHHEAIIANTPKISRGEKYEGLPYMILDYPRIFGREDILAIRTLFWWGNYCSVTLHVKGRWQEAVVQKIISQQAPFMLQPCYVSFSGDEWNHNVHDLNYTEMQDVPGEEILQEINKAGFLKLAAKVTIDSWSIMEKELFSLFVKLVKLL